MRELAIGLKRLIINSDPATFKHLSTYIVNKNVLLAFQIHVYVVQNALFECDYFEILLPL